MSAITVWIDESEVIQADGTSTWIIGQLITNSDVQELDFLKKLKEARRTARTWNTLHATEFDHRDTRKWNLLNSWVSLFKSERFCFFHAFVFDETAWRGRYASAHHYWANQFCFGLASKMKQRASYPIQVLLGSVDTVTMIMDRRAATTGHVSKFETGRVTIERTNDIEAIYEAGIKRVILRESGRSATNFGLRFCFSGSSCFDALQLCDCLTYMVRKRFMYENGIDSVAITDDYVDLWNRYFLDPGVINQLSDYHWDKKFNYFRSTGSPVVFP